MNAVKGTVGDRNGLELSRTLSSAGSDPIGSSAEPFATQHLLPDLKRHTISGGVITMSAQGAKFVMNLVATVALARLLTPRDFGLIAMVASVTGFLTVFRHAGLATPTIQREHITQAQVANLFWVNLGVSGLCTVIVAAWLRFSPGFIMIRDLLPSRSASLPLSSSVGSESSIWHYLGVNFVSRPSLLLKWARWHWGLPLELSWR